MQDQTRLLFRTPSGGRAIPAGETVRLTAGFSCGIPVSKYGVIRIYCNSSAASLVPISLRIDALDCRSDELLFRLDAFTLEAGESSTRVYEVPAQALSVSASAAPGEGQAVVEFGVLGYGPQYWSCESGSAAPER
jgi:hypothetical protein